MPIIKNYNQGDLTRITGEEDVDVREMLARQKTNTLWTNYRLDTEDEELKVVFDNLKKHNDLLLLFKGAERFLSKDGKIYFCWDIWNKGEIGNSEKQISVFYAFPSSRNQTMRYFQQKEYAGVCEIQPTTNDSGIYQRFIQLRTINQTETKPISIGFVNQIPIDIFWFQTPKFLSYWNNISNKTRTHNYGVLSIKELLNINIIDYGRNSEQNLSDDYPVAHLREMINGMLVFYKKELNKNQTKWVGEFGSFQDFYKEKPKSAQAFYALQKLGNGNINKNVAQKYVDMIDPNRQPTILEDDYIINLRSSNAKVDKMQSTFDGEAIARAITSLLEIYFNGAGYDYSVQSLSGQAQYTSTSEIQTQNRRTTESIKMTIVLRQNQYKEIFENIIDAWFGEVGYHKKFENKWEFKVISNIVNEEAYSVEKIVLMKENGLISNDLAIEKANKDLSEGDITKLKEEIKKEEKEKEEKEIREFEMVNNSSENRLLGSDNE